MKYVYALVGSVLIGLSVLLYAAIFCAALLWALNFLELIFGNIFFNVMDGVVPMNGPWLLVLRVVGLFVPPIGSAMAVAF